MKINVLVPLSPGFFPILSNKHNYFTRAIKLYYNRRLVNSTLPEPLSARPVRVGGAVFGESRFIADRLSASSTRRRTSREISCPGSNHDLSRRRRQEHIRVRVSK